MKRILVSLLSAAFVLLGSMRGQSGVIQYELVITENSSQSLDVIVDGTPVPVALVAPDNWLIDWGPAPLSTRTDFVSFQEPDLADRPSNLLWNHVIIKGTSLSVLSDQALALGPTFPIGSTADILVGVVDNIAPAHDSGARLLIAFHDNAQLEHSVPERGNLRLLLGAALAGLVVGKRLLGGLALFA
jgi:hypothetical protein